MIMYVPQATPLERGPTGVIPGSQYQTQRPDEALTPEVPGCLEIGGFLLIHYDIWHRKMKNFTKDRRFMMKFEFIRMNEPISPSWNHADPEWRLSDLPGLDLSAVWQRQWDWLRGSRRQDEAFDGFDAVDLTDRDPHRRLAAINTISRNGGAACYHLRQLAALLRDPLEPVAVDAAYAMAGAGSDAVQPLLDIVRSDTQDDPEPERGPDDGSRHDTGAPARSAAYGLSEIGLPSVPGLLDILENGIGSRSRKLAAFALSEIAGTPALATDALCRATHDAAAAVRINAVEALGLKPATPDAIVALSRAMVDRDAQVRFSATLSLAQIGPAAEAAVPVLSDALHDENRYVPGYAVEALERIGTPEAMRVLLPFLKAARWCPHTSPASIY
jgi:HEAT repeat protein